MKHQWKKVFAGLCVGLLGLVWRGAGLVVHAQTTPTPTSTAPAADVHNDFEFELQQLRQLIEQDVAAQKVADEIDSEDSESAGDNLGDNIVIDGEKSDTEIQQEIDDEVNVENPENVDHQDNEENVSTSTLEDNGPSFDDQGNVQDQQSPDQSSSGDSRDGSDSGN